MTPECRPRTRSKAPTPSRRRPRRRPGRARAVTSWPGSASARWAPRVRRRDEVLRCRPYAGRGRLGRPRSRTNGSSPRCPGPRRGPGPPCSLGRALVPARRRVSSSARAPTVLLVRSGAGRVTGPTHHPRTHGHRLGRTTHCFPREYGGARPIRAPLRHATPGGTPVDAPPGRDTPPSPGTATHRVPSPDRSPIPRPSRVTGGPARPVPRSVGNRRTCGGGLCGDPGFARFHGVDRLVGLLFVGLVVRLFIRLGGHRRGGVAGLLHRCLARLPGRSRRLTRLVRR